MKTLVLTVNRKKSENNKLYLIMMLLGMIGLITSLSANAQNLTKPDDKTASAPDQVRIEKIKGATHIIAEGGVDQSKTDSVKQLLDLFYYDQYRHYQDPHAPYFMFLSKNANLAMGVGGVVRLRGYFDWNGSIPANGFSPYQIPIPKDPTSMERLAANASGTGLFFTILGKSSRFGSYMAFFQGDFSGYNNRDFKLKKAYLTAGDWTVGLANSTFEDTAAEPQTVDGAGANGVTSHTGILVRYMHTFKGKWVVAGGLEFPQSSISADGIHTKACSDYVPDIAAFGQYQWNGGVSHIRLSGLLRTLKYRDLTKEKNLNILGWAAQVSTVIKVMPQMNVYGIASVGEGHASYTADLGIGDFDLIQDGNNLGKLYAPASVGYVLGAQYYFLPNLYSNLCLSEQRYYPKKNPGDGQYKYGLYGAINLYWDITPRFEVGMEYLAGKRMNFNGDHGSANRLMAMMMLSF